MSTPPTLLRQRPKEISTLCLDTLLLSGIVMTFVGASIILAFMAWQMPGAVRAASQPTLTCTSAPTSTHGPTDTPMPTPTATASPISTSTAIDTPSPTSTATRVVPAASVLTTSLGAKWIDLDLSEQALTAYEGETPVFSALMSTGLPYTPTPVGDFKIYRKVRAQAMGGPDYYLPNVEFVSYFYEGNAIHGTYWHDNFGQPMSHGCVNLRNADAQWIYDWAPIGTPVRVHR